MKNLNEQCRELTEVIRKKGSAIQDKTPELLPVAERVLRSELTEPRHRTAKCSTALDCTGLESNWV